MVPMDTLDIPPTGTWPRRLLQACRYFQRRFPGGVLSPGFDIPHRQLDFGHNGFALVLADTDDPAHQFLMSQTDVIHLDEDTALSSEKRRALSEMLGTASITAVDRLGVGMRGVTTIRTLQELALAYQAEQSKKLPTVTKQGLVTVTPNRKTAADAADAFTGKPIHLGGREH